MSLPEVNHYERSTFFQLLKKSAKPVFGQGWVVTKTDLKAAFWAVNPEYADAPMSDQLFDLTIAEALKIEAEENGFKVIEA